MTQLEFYTERGAEAYKTAVNICKSRREKAGISGLCDADVEMEYCLILREWYDDYCGERV